MSYNYLKFIIFGSLAYSIFFKHLTGQHQIVVKVGLYKWYLIEYVISNVIIRQYFKQVGFHSSKQGYKP